MTDSASSLFYGLMRGASTRRCARFWVRRLAPAILALLQFSLPAASQTDTTDVWLSNGPAGQLLINDLAIDPQFPDTLYAATFPGTVHRSLNGGGSWAEVGASIADSVLSLAINPANSAVIYAGTRNNGVYKTTNRGSTWASSSTGLPDPQVSVLFIDPVDTSRVYAGTPDSLFVSANGGQTWTTTGIDTLSVQVTALAINPLDPNVVYAGTDGAGVYRTQDGGSAWTTVNTGLTSLRISGLAVDPGAPSIVYATTLDQGVFRSANGGGGWVPTNTGLTNLQVTSLAIAPSNSNVVYVGTLNSTQVFRSSDKGGTWTDLTRDLPTGIAVSGLAVHPDSVSVIYAGLGAVYRIRWTGLEYRAVLATSAAPTALGLVDFDGDGNPDPVVANAADGTVTFFISRDRGTFFSTRDLVVGGEPATVSAGDLDQDGDDDLVVGNRSSRLVTTLINAGPEDFAYGSDLYIGDAPSASAVADIDGDEKLDILTANPSGNTVSVFFNNGNGVFLAQLRFACGTEPSDLAVADFDGDGLLDVLAANRGDGTVSLLRNTGEASLGIPEATGVGDEPVELVAEDFDLDGDVDAAVIASGSREVVVLANAGDGTFAVSDRVPFLYPPTALASGDLDGDQYVDLVVSSGPQSIYLIPNTGRGRFTLAVQSLDGASGIGSLGLVDLDLDGDPDLLALQPAAQTLQVRRNDLPADIKPPAPPPSFSAEDLQGDLGGRIRLAWSLPRADEQTGRHTGYRVYRSEASGGPFVLHGRVSVASAAADSDSVAVYRTYIDSTAIVNTPYFYTLASVGPGSTVSAASETATATSRAQPYFLFDFSEKAVYNIGDTIQVSVSLDPLDFDVSGVSLYLDYDSTAVSLLDGQPTEEGVQPVLPPESILANSQVLLENRLNIGVKGKINYSLASFTAPDTGNVDLGLLRFVALKDTLTTLTVVDSPSVNRRTAVVEEGSGQIILPYIVPRSYALRIQGIRIFARARLQGRGGMHATDLRVDLRRPDGSSLPDTLYSPPNDRDQDPANGVQLRSETDGRFTLLHVPAGSYDVYVKGYHYLRSRVVGDTVVVDSTSPPELRFYRRSSTGTTVTDTLRGGDANDDNQINLTDFGILASTFGAFDVTQGSQAWQADFNGDGAVNLADFGILASNFGESGMGLDVVTKPATGPSLLVLFPGENGSYALALAGSDPILGFSAEVRVHSGGEDAVQAAAGESLTGVDSEALWIERAAGSGSLRIAAHVGPSGEPLLPGAVLAQITVDGAPPLLAELYVIDLEGSTLAVGRRDAVTQTRPDLPDHPALYANVPNPFNPSTTIRYDVSEEADVSLAVYNLLGQTVRALVDERRPPGSYSVRWDGRDASGRNVASGIYLYRVSIGSFKAARKLLLLK